MYHCHQKLEELRENLGVVVEIKKFSPTKNKPFKKEILTPPFGQMLQPEEDGFLEEVEARTPLNFALIIKIPRNRFILPVIVSGKERRIKTLGDQTPEAPEAAYIKVVPTIPTEEENWETTKYHRDNNARLVWIAGDLFSMWEIGVATRIKETAKHFLTIQENYRGKMYNLSGTVIIPEFQGFDQWGDLQNILEKWPDPTLAHLKKVRGLKKPPPEKGWEPEEKKAKVLYFNLASGKGKAATKDGLLTLHWSKIKKEERFAHLEKGQVISFESTAPENEFTENLQAVGIEVMA